MDVKTFVEVAKSLPANISILVKGDTGIGKSQIVRQIAREIKTNWTYVDHEGPGLPVLDWRLSVFSEGDIIGLPDLIDDPNSEGRETTFAPNNRFMMACRDPYVLFLDEGNRATPEVLQCAFQIVLDRELNGHKLHPETRIIMAINEGNDFMVNDMDPALLRRFWVTELIPTTNDWISWAIKNDIDPIIVSFIKKYPSHLMHSGERNPGTVYPYPASWHRLDSSLKHADIEPSKFAGGDIDDLLFYFASGFVGSITSAAFVDYIRNYKLKISAEDVLDDFDQYEDEINLLTSDKKNEIIDYINLYLAENNLSNDQASNLNKFLGCTSDEVVYNFMQEALEMKNLHNSKMIYSFLKNRIMKVYENSKLKGKTLQ